MHKLLITFIAALIGSVNLLANNDLADFQYVKSEGQMPEQVKEVLTSDKKE